MEEEKDRRFVQRIPEHAEQERRSRASRLLKAKTSRFAIVSALAASAMASLGGAFASLERSVAQFDLAVRFPKRKMTLRGKPRRGVLSASYTKRGPGRYHRSGDPRKPPSSAGDDGARFSGGYMNRGERERYAASRLQG